MTPKKSKHGSANARAEAIRLDAEIRALVAERELSLAPLRTEVDRLGESARELRDRIEFLGEKCGLADDVSSSVPPVVARLLDAAHLLLSFTRPAVTPEVEASLEEVEGVVDELREESEESRREEEAAGRRP